MKLTSRYKTFVVCASVFTGVLFAAPYLAPTDIACQHTETLAMPQCTLAEQQSWFSWIRGESRSTQFHFVDLLELLNRLTPAK